MRKGGQFKKFGHSGAFKGKCFNCGKHGHKASQCKEKKNKKFHGEGKKDKDDDEEGKNDVHDETRRSKRRSKSPTLL